MRQSPLGTARIIKPADLVSARLLVCREHRLNQRIGEKKYVCRIFLFWRVSIGNRVGHHVPRRVWRQKIGCQYVAVIVESLLKRTLISGVAFPMREKRQRRKRLAGIKSLVPLCRRVLKKCLKTAIVSLHGENEFTQIAFFPRERRGICLSLPKHENRDRGGAEPYVFVIGIKDIRKSAPRIFPVHVVHQIRLSARRRRKNGFVAKRLPDRKKTLHRKNLAYRVIFGRVFILVRIIQIGERTVFPLVFGNPLPDQAHALVKESAGDMLIARLFLRDTRKDDRKKSDNKNSK